MRVKALKNFVGELCMAIGEEKEISDSKAEKLIAIGYVEPVNPAPKTSKKQRKAVTAGEPDK